MKKANLACAPLSIARISGKFGGINLTRLQAKFENLKFKSKFCGADGFLKPNPNLLKFDEASSKFEQSENKKPTKSSQNKASAFSAASRTEPSNFKLQNPKERKNK